MNRKIIVVLGMHRSGTSLITRSLLSIGIELGGNLMPAVESVNAKGFWEDLDINAINIELLEILGSSWFSLSNISKEDFTEKNLSRLRVRAKFILSQKLQNFSSYGVKDPRMSRLLPFWIEIFNELKLDVTYIVAFRNPLSVAASLKKRDGFDDERSFYLWLEHYVSILEFTEGARRIFVDYDLVIDDPEVQIRRIAKEVGIYFDDSSSVFNEFFSNFVDKKLRHFSYTEKQLENRKDEFPEVFMIHTMLLDFSRDLLSINTLHFKKIIKNSRKKLTSYNPLLKYIDRSDKMLSEFACTINQKNIEIVGLNNQVNNFHLLQEEMKKEIDFLKNNITALLQSRSWRFTYLFRKLREFFKN